jgi:hypothetical protein
MCPAYALATNEQFLQLTFSPFSRISSALGPRTVQCTAIFSFLRIPNERTVKRATKQWYKIRRPNRVVLSPNLSNRLVFDQLEPPEPLLRESVDHHSRRRKCSELASRYELLA